MSALVLGSPIDRCAYAVPKGRNVSRQHRLLRGGPLQSDLVLIPFSNLAVEIRAAVPRARVQGVTLSRASSLSPAATAAADRRRRPCEVELDAHRRPGDLTPFRTVCPHADKAAWLRAGFQVKLAEQVAVVHARPRFARRHCRRRRRETRELRWRRAARRGENKGRGRRKVDEAHEGSLALISSVRPSRASSKCLLRYLEV